MLLRPIRYYPLFFFTWLILFQSIGFSNEIDYPLSKISNVQDNYHGNIIDDHYRWLEDLNSLETSEWIQSQNKFTDEYLNGYKEINLFKEILSKDGIDIISPSRDDLDLSSPKSIDDFLSQLTTHIDIVINNAGILKVGQHDEISTDDFHEVFQVNVVAPFKIISGVIEDMKHQKFGRIVNISSIWGQKSKEGRTLYSSSKAALDALTRSLAIEFASYNILINSVAPGYIETDMLKQYNTEKELSTIRDKIPMKRFGKKIEIAELVKFLCSENNSYITGQILTIDGGYVCK